MQLIHLTKVWCICVMRNSVPSYRSVLSKCMPTPPPIFDGLRYSHKWFVQVSTQPRFLACEFQALMDTTVHAFAQLHVVYMQICICRPHIITLSQSHIITHFHAHIITHSHAHIITRSRYHILPCSHYHTLPCSHYHTLPCSHYHTLPCSHYHTLPCSHYHTLPCTHTR